MRKFALTSPLTHGDDVAALQRAMNRELRSWGYPTVSEDGQYGPQTAHAVMTCGYWLGASHTELNKHRATSGLERIILHPSLRSPADLIRARSRHRPAHSSNPVNGALEWARSKIGVHEQPPYSNSGPEIDTWEKLAGIGTGNPWCGCFVGAALHQVGHLLSFDYAYTPYIFSHAQSRTGGLTGLYRWQDRKPGDLILFNFGSSEICQHVGILDLDNEHTIEGNTSPGDGSQDNGGVVARRNRGSGPVVGCARWI